jgi:glycosyltransferase involved in cell wall biosynthesis
MRICYVAFQFWPSVGGSQTQAEKQARYLLQLGQEVLVVTLRHQRTWPAREIYRTIPVFRVGGWYRRNRTLRVGRFGCLLVSMRLFLTLWSLRRSYDLIHTLQVSPLAVVAVLLGRLIQKPVVIGVQSTGSYISATGTFARGAQEQMVPFSGRIDGQNSWKKAQLCVRPAEIGGDIATLQRTALGGRLMLNCLRKSNAYYQILSVRSYAYLVEYGFRPERIVCIPNGVDTRKFYPVFWAAQGQAELRADRTLLCVARLEYAKGIDILLRAWARMMAQPASWREGLQPWLYLVGDGASRAELEQLAAELGIRESVEFLGTRHDVPQLLQDAWGFVLPSRWEGMPNALLEAMACALPCIATRVSGSEDVIEQGLNGLLVEPEQPEQLAYALRLLIEDAYLARQLGWRGYETVLRSYQLDSTVQNSLTFYRYLLTRDHSHRRSRNFITKS